MNSRFLWKSLLLVTGVLLLSLLLNPLTNLASPPGQAGSAGPVIVSQPVSPALSRPARAITTPSQPALMREINPRHNPLQLEPDMGRRGTWNRTSIPIDPLIARSLNTSQRAPDPLLSFEGVGNLAGVSPPDPVGAVGLNHYVQMVNVQFAVYDKAGNLLSGPTPFNALFAGAGGNCEAQNAGDPVPVYDALADRWLLSQFASPSHMCIAISTSPDPSGTYYLYEFNVGQFPDYFKFGAWPDGYYMSANETSYTAYVFDRAKMLAGNAATFQKFTGQDNFLLPADLDGPTAPPAGSPNYFYTFKDNVFHGGGLDRVEVFAFAVDWTTPANSTFTLVDSITVSPFTYTACGFFNFNCIRQPGTFRRVDSLGEWPMFSLRYRNFGSHETLVGTFGVGGGSGQVGAAVRWFELRKTAADWTLYQEGTYDPGDGHDRFNSSIAMDAKGNIALGYSVSSSSLYPSIRYTTHAVTDTLGAMQAEVTLKAGSGSQTGSNRWGDYSAMSVDPADDCTFWYTNEYYPVSSSNGWKTYIGAFRVPGCAQPDARIAFTKTVGLDLTACASDTEISVESGTRVTYCYQIRNTGEITFTRHSLFDDHLGQLLDDFPAEVAPGASLAVTQSVVLTTSTINLAAWTAADGLTTTTVDAAATVTVTPTYSLSLTTTGSGSGSVTVDPDQSIYSAGSVVTLTAIPAVDSRFVAWTGDLMTTTNPITLTMDGNKAITATFDIPLPITYTLTITTAGSGSGSVVIGSGSVIVDPDQSVYSAGNVVTLTAIPAIDSRFVLWVGDIMTTTNPVTLTMDADKAVGAIFDRLIGYRLLLPLIRKEVD